MPRNCPYQRQLIRLASDAAFRVLPPLVRLLLHELLAFAAAAPEAGRLRFPGSVIASVSRLVSLSETEVETGLETLAAIGWVEHEAATNTLWMQGARANNARAEAARINGLRGGRPPKIRPGVPGQSTMMLPIPGGLAETHGTEVKPNPESSRAVLPTTSCKEEVSNAREVAPWVVLGEEVVVAAGISQTAGADLSFIRAWLKQGATAELILATVRTVAKRPTYDGNRVHTLKFFDGPMQEALAKRRSAATVAGGDVLTVLAEDKLLQAQQAWAANPVGPMPRRAAA